MHALHTLCRNHPFRGCHWLLGTALKCDASIAIVYHKFASLGAPPHSIGRFVSSALQPSSRFPGLTGVKKLQGAFFFGSDQDELA